jgi:hypothetical protein
MHKSFFAASAVALAISALLAGCDSQRVHAIKEQAKNASAAHMNFFLGNQDVFCNGPYTLTALSSIEDCGGIVEVRYGTFAGATEYYLVREVEDDWKPVPYRIDAGKLVQVDSSFLDGCFDSRYASGEVCIFHKRFTAGTYTKGRAVNPLWKQILETQFGGEGALAST